MVTVIPTPSDAQWQIYWTVLALMVAAFGALLPGFIEVKHKNILRAGGAIGLFVIVLFGGSHIKMLGGATREDKLAQADGYVETYLAERGDEIRRDKLDLLTKAADIYDNNPDSNPTGEIGFARALDTLVSARATSRTQAQFALDRYAGLVSSYLVRVVDSYDDVNARSHCDFLATNILASELTFKTLVRTWKFSSAPLKKAGSDWNRSRCVAAFRMPKSSYPEWNE